MLLMLAMAVALVAGLVLIGEATRTRPDHPACRQCNYNLTGLPKDTSSCPECGQALTARSVVQARERWVNTTMLVFGICLAGAAPFGCCAGSALLNALVGP